MLVLAAVELRDARDRAGGHGMISTKRKRDFSGFEGLDDELGMLGARGRDFFQIFRVSVAFFFLLRDGDGNVAAVLDFVTEGLEAGFQAGHADGRRSHIDAASRLAKVEGNANDADFSGRDARGACCCGHSRQ